MNAQPRDAPAPAAQPGPTTPTTASAASPSTRLQGGSIRLFRVAGIDVWLHWSWFLFALLRLQSTESNEPWQAVHYESQVWYLVEYLGLFGFVLLHEFGHVLACRSVGGTANTIVLWPLGGLALIDPPARPGPILWSIAAGPLVNALLVAPTVGLWLAGRAAGLEEAAPDLYQLSVALAWSNGFLLAFNLLPVFPLDGGRMLQAVLWLVLGRVRSMLLATVIGLLTALALLIVSIVERSLVWGIMAGFGVLFSLIGVQAARALLRVQRAPGRTATTCPACGAEAPIGNFWACGRCWTAFDLFALHGSCPKCSAPVDKVLCPRCGAARPYLEWHPEGAPPPAAPTPVTPPVTATQRLVWGAIFATLALALCGLPSADKQPLGLIVWTVGGAILGATSAGTLTRNWRTAQARKKLCGTWRLTEVDGQPSAGADPARQLILTQTHYEERVAGKRTARGTCWTDPWAEPPALSLTPTKTSDTRPRPGIYRLEGITLTLCLALPDHPRPATIAALPAVQEVRVYRRDGKAGKG